MPSAWSCSACSWDLIGTDVNSGTQRFTFDLPELADGIGFVIVAMGMFGLGEIIRNLENEADALRDGDENQRPVADARRTSSA